MTNPPTKKSMLTQKEYSGLKSRLTRRENALKKARDGENFSAVEKAAKEVIAEVSYANSVFEQKGWPDQWSNWTCAKEDAEMVMRRPQGLRGGGGW